MKEKKVGIDETSFGQYYRDGSAEKALEEDLKYTHSLGIHSLPAYLIHSSDKPS